MLRTFGMLIGLTATSCVFAVVDDPTPICGEHALLQVSTRTCYCPTGWEGDPWDLEVGCTPIMTLLITDACDDGEDIRWKLWSLDRDWTWPAGESYYATRGLSVDAYQDIVCHAGESICFGGGTEETIWGVGLEGPDVNACSDCCFECDAVELDLGRLTCG